MPAETLRNRQEYNLGDDMYNADLLVSTRKD